MRKSLKMNRFGVGIVALVVGLFAGGCCPRPLMMADTAFRANVVATNPPAVMTPGQKIQLRVDVKNVSDVAWHTNGLDPSYKLRSSDDDMYRMYLANHWLDANEKMKINDDGRAALPEVLAPGESATISLAINAPKDPGEYVLELDLVQENVTWFGAKGSTTAKHRIKVE